MPQKQHEKQQKQDQIRLIAFSVASTVLIAGWSMFFQNKGHNKSSSSHKATNTATSAVQHQQATKKGSSTTQALVNQAAEQATASDWDNQTFPTTAQSLVASQKTRIKLDNDQMEGSINLVGATLDEITLKRFKENMKQSNNVEVLYPRDTQLGHYIVTGWIPIEGISPQAVPSSTTKWKGPEGRLAPTRPITLEYNNGKGVNFQIKFAIDNQHMVTITQMITNNSGKSITLQPFANITNNLQDPYAKAESYQGPLGYLGEELKEISFKKLLKNSLAFPEQANAWAGISQKYWLTSIRPNGTSEISLKMLQIGKKLYQAKIIAKQNQVTIGNKQSLVTTTDAFIGPKSLSLLDQYSKEKNLPLFSRAIDLGRLYFITKPIIMLLKSINLLTKNYGVSIILMTILIRIALIPLAGKSYRAINKMKALAPQMEEIKKQYKEKKQADLAILELYRKEKINPLAGFVPLLLQIPIFFALYKALYVSIELRHSVFISGWINDLSAPDPTSFANLFGLLPYQVPSFLNIGILPIIMGVTMWLQQKGGSVGSLNADQEKIMKLLPVIFVFLFSKFPAGLVLYWIATNTFSIFQDKIIKNSLQAEKSKQLK